MISKIINKLKLTTILMVIPQASKANGLPSFDLGKILSTLGLIIFALFIMIGVISTIKDSYKKDKKNMMQQNDDLLDIPQLILVDRLMMIHFLLAIILILIGYIEVKPSYLIQFKYIYFSFAFFLIFSSITFKVKSKAWGIVFTIPTLLIFVIWTIIMQINASHNVSGYYQYIYSNLTIANISIIFYSIYMCFVLLKIQKDYFK